MNEILKALEKEEDYYLFFPSKEYDFEVVRLSSGGYILLRWESDLWLEFAVFSDAGEGDDSMGLMLQFHGRGPVGILRELRHTYWGENGYLFYPNVITIKEGLDFLSQFYDNQ